MEEGAGRSECVCGGGGVLGGGGGCMKKGGGGGKGGTSTLLWKRVQHGSQIRSLENCIYPHTCHSYKIYGEVF